MSTRWVIGVLTSALGGLLALGISGLYARTLEIQKTLVSVQVQIAHLESQLAAYTTREDVERIIDDRLKYYTGGRP